MDMASSSSAFAWVEVPASALNQGHTADFSFTFTPQSGVGADNVTPPHPKTLAAADDKSVGISINKGQWTITTDKNIPLRMAAGPMSELNTWLQTPDGQTWIDDQDVLLLVVKYKG
jgi:hypothetical protein